MTEESLRGKTVKGVGWSFIDSFAGQGITFLVGLILARLLTPDEYGLIGIIMIFVTIFNCIVNSGFSNALIRKNDAQDIDYSTVFYVNLFISCILFGVFYFSAPLIASFFSQPLLEPLSKAMACIVIINAFAIIQRTILVKIIDFKTQTKISLSASIISGLVGIIMAFYGYGVWSLVAQQISRQSINTILLWTYSKWYPKLQFSLDSFKELFGFGWKLMASSLLDTIWGEIYQVVIGIFYTPAILGQYSRAHQFSGIFSSNLNGVVQRVSYPVLSSIKDESERLKDAYRRIIKVTMLVTFVLMLGLAAISRPMILVLIGEKWQMAAEILPIICLQMMLYPLHSLNLNMLQVQGRSDLFLRLEIIKKCIGLCPILLGIFINIHWMLWGSVCYGVIAYYLNSYYSGKLLGYSFINQLRDIMPLFCIASFMAILIYFISFLPLSPIIVLVFQIIAGIIIIVLVCELFKIEEYLEIKRILFSKIGR